MTKYAVHIEYANGKEGERVYPTRLDAEVEAEQMKARPDVVSVTVLEVEKEKAE